MSNTAPQLGQYSPDVMLSPLYSRKRHVGRPDALSRRPYEYLLMTRQAFWPPNPKLFESTALTSASRATFGT